MSDATFAAFRRRLQSRRGPAYFQRLPVCDSNLVKNSSGRSDCARCSSVCNSVLEVVHAIFLWVRVRLYRLVQLIQPPIRCWLFNLHWEDDDEEKLFLFVQNQKVPSGKNESLVHFCCRMSHIPSSFTLYMDHWHTSCLVASLKKSQQIQDQPSLNNTRRLGSWNRFQDVEGMKATWIEFQNVLFKRSSATSQELRLVDVKGHVESLVSRSMKVTEALLTWPLFRAGAHGQDRKRMEAETFRKYSRRTASRRYMLKFQWVCIDAEQMVRQSLWRRSWELKNWFGHSGHSETLCIWSSLEW